MFTIRPMVAMTLLAGVVLTSCGGDARRDGSVDSDAAVMDTGPGDSDAGTAMDGGAFMCELLADPTLCWNVLVGQLYECVPDEVGVLDPGRSACNFSDGTIIEFGQPLPTRIEGPPLFLPDFIVRRASGEECGAFYERGERAVAVDLVASLFVQDPGPRLKLICLSEGVPVEAFNAPFSEVIDCAFDEGLAAPGWQATIDESSITFAVVSGGNNSPDTLFACALAE